MSKVVRVDQGIVEWVRECMELRGRGWQLRGAESYRIEIVCCIPLQLKEKGKTKGHCDLKG